MRSNSIFTALINRGFHNTEVNVLGNGFINVVLEDGREFNCRSIGRMLDLINAA